MICKNSRAGGKSAKEGERGALLRLVLVASSMNDKWHFRIRVTKEYHGKPPHCMKVKEAISWIVEW